MGLGNIGFGILGDTVASALASVHDNFVIDRNTGVTIRLRHAKAGSNLLTNLPLAGQIQFNVQAHYAEPFKSFVGILDAANQFLTGGFGISYRQPWFNYRVWQHTDPIGFSVPLVFTAALSAKEEVMDPVWALIRLVLPMMHPEATLDVGVLERGMATGLNLVGQMGNAVADAFGLGSDPDSGTRWTNITIEEGATGKLRAFIPPGPNFAYSLENARVPFANVFRGVAGNVKRALGGGGNNLVYRQVGGESEGSHNCPGLPVSVRIGNYLDFHTCYVDGVSVSLSPQMSPDGYPLSATATVNFRTMAAPFMNQYGQIVLESGGFMGNSGLIHEGLGSPDQG